MCSVPMARISDAPRPLLVRYGAAIVATALATLLRVALDPILGDRVPFALYFAAVTFTAWFAGFGPAVLSVLCGAALGDYIFVEPRGTFFIWDPLQDQLSLGVHVAVGILVGYVSDLWTRQRKRAEAALRASEERLHKHQAELAHLARVNMMGEMAASLAHELNQPLHAVKNYASGSIRRLLKNPQQDEDLLTALAQINEEADRAAGIIRRIRNFVRKREPQVGRVSLNHLLQEVVLLNKTEFAERQTQVRQDLAADLPAIVGDAIQIEQVLMNLVRNGLESMDQTAAGRRRLELKTARHGDDAIEVGVRDAGRGIDEADLEKVFEPFFSTKAEGMGMGLAISRSIVQTHGGRLWVSRNEDQGCTFHFTLPLPKSSHRSDRNKEVDVEMARGLV